MKRSSFLFLLPFLFASIPPAAQGQAASEPATIAAGLAKGQTIYVPLYSHIFFGDTTVPFNLTGTLSIRNTDMHHAILILSATYYDSSGKPVREYLPNPVLLAPLASTNCIVPESDSAGGFGASFIVKWRSAAPVNTPILEAVMIGTSGQQGISFISRGQALAE